MPRINVASFQLLRSVADDHGAPTAERRLKAAREAAPPAAVSRPATATRRKIGQTKHPSLWIAAGTAIGHAAATLLIWRQRARLRRQLLALDNHALGDIGISRSDTAGDGNSPFWRARIDFPHGF